MPDEVYHPPAQPSYTELQRMLQLQQHQMEGVEFVWKIAFDQMGYAEGLLEEVYRRLYPEEEPWPLIEDERGHLHSPYRWDKLFARLDQLIALAHS